MTANGLKPNDVVNRILFARLVVIFAISTFYAVLNAKVDWYSYSTYYLQ